MKGLIFIIFKFVIFALKVKAGVKVKYFQIQNSSNTIHRVVFGHDVPSGQFVPYQVSLQYHTKSGEYKHFCGGSIISTDRILTAGHCCDGLNINRVTVVTGIRSLNDSDGNRSLVTKCTIHENYMKTDFNDIAIIDIKPPLTFSENRKAINISRKEFVEGNLPVLLTGWGLRLPIELPNLPTNVEHINFPSTLQQLNYYTLSNDECRAQGMTEVSEKEICAIRKQLLPQGACIGDSGGPLVILTENGPKQIGLVSYGFRICGILPDVYTRLSQYIEWIEDKMT